MTVSHIDFPIYIIIIILSIFFGMIYIFKSLKKSIRIDNNIFLYFLLTMLLILFFGKVFTMITSKSTDFLTIGLSSYGGAIGLIVSSLFFEKIMKLDGFLIKYSIISLPLIYGLSKIACFIVGCCYGLPYNSFFSVTYTNGLNIPLFPVQFVETIVFIIIFIICNKYKNCKNIIWITIFTSSLFKFLLDFLRYEHINKIITINQIISIFLMVVVIISLSYSRFKNN